MTMVRARTSFAALVAGQMRSIQAGAVLELPPGADWLTAGLVELVADAPPEIETTEAPPPPEIETTEAPPPPGAEHAVTRKRKAK